MRWMLTVWKQVSEWVKKPSVRISERRENLFQVMACYFSNEYDINSTLTHFYSSDY